VLHAFFSTATRVVEAHGGVIEAFQGDAVLAVWYGAEYQDGQEDALNAQGAKKALQAAVDLYRAMQGTLPDPAPAGLEPLSLGVGLECGPAMAGSFGLASRRTHMVMGRTVTIASRLVDMTADLAHPVLVGEGLAAQLAGEGLSSMGTFLLDGLRVPHHVYAYRLFDAPSSL
jgi:adenylate cyclase